MHDDVKKESQRKQGAPQEDHDRGRSCRGLGNPSSSSGVDRGQAMPRESQGDDEDEAKRARINEDRHKRSKDELPRDRDDDTKRVKLHCTSFAGINKFDVEAELRHTSRTSWNL